MNVALTFLSITVLSISATPFGQELAAPVKVSEFGGKAVETEHGEEDWRKLEEASKAPAGAPAARRQLPASTAPTLAGCIWLTYGHGPTRPWSCMACGSTQRPYTAPPYPNLIPLLPLTLLSPQL